ncbi:hypothetical protein PMIN06_001318 [Paraphaeosphaeria minitans]|uniref:Uncharacterized protein n=1 Tax=Paraphaeosphaeria minitans TaxID=565426 RepID=A0A9P6G7S7_9PLEO|nr:hypothetical protein PMIN01_11336 [Paraphaeosphaeria minitans]
MAYGKKKVAFERKKRTPRSASPRVPPVPSSPARSWSSASSSLAFTETKPRAKPGDTLSDSVSRPMPATKPVRFSLSREEDISVEELHDVATSTDLDSVWHTPAASQFTRQSLARIPESPSSTSSHSDDSLGGVGVGSVPASLMCEGSLFVPEKESFEQRARCRSRQPPSADIGSLHSTSGTMPIGPLSRTSSYSPSVAYGSRRPGPPRAPLATVMESYSSIDIKPSFLHRQPSLAAQAARQARDAKLSSTLGRHASSSKPVPRTSALRREHRPAPRFPPIQHEPPNPREHGTVVQHGFPGVKPKEEPVLCPKKDEVEEWKKYRGSLDELKERHHVNVEWEGKGKWWGGASRCI